MLRTVETEVSLSMLEEEGWAGLLSYAELYFSVSREFFYKNTHTTHINNLMLIHSRPHTKEKLEVSLSSLVNVIASSVLT